MIVSSPALPTSAMDLPTAAPAAAAEGAESAGGKDFASLLAGDSAPGSATNASTGTGAGTSKTEDASLSLGQNSTASGNQEAPEGESDDESDPTPMEQMNLAALLYARPLTTPPPPVQTGETISVSKPIFAPTSATSSLIGESTLPLFTGTPIETTTGTPTGPSAELPAAPSTSGSTFALPPAPSETVPTAAAANTLPLATPASVFTSPATPPSVTMAPTPAAPAQPSASAVSQNASSIPAPTAVNAPKALQAQPAEIAATPAAEAVIAENIPAISTPATTPASASPDESRNSDSPAKADVSLISEQSLSGNTARGTTGAKAVREMKATTITPANSDPESKTGPVSLQKESAGAGKSANDLQDSPSTDPSTDQPGSQTFSISTPAQSSHAARTEASARPAESAPMTPTAVVKELTHGLERIQQRGQDRMDLRLSLEGGGEVSIALQVRDGAVHASFQTSSPEMRAALQQGWAQMAARGENLAIPLAEPVFKSSSNLSSDAGPQQDPRERRQEPSPEQNHRAAAYQSSPSQPKRAAQPAAPARRASSGLNLYA